MPTSGETQQALSRLLSDELQSARELQRTLDQEFDALSQGEADRITEITAQKQLQTLRLGQHLQARDRFLAEHKLPAGQQGTDAIVKRLPADAAAANLWQELQSVGRRLRERNEVNGGIIAHGQRHVRQALAILSGQSGTGDTYGPEGTSCPGQLSQALAKA